VIALPSSRRPLYGALWMRVLLAPLLAASSALPFVVFSPACDDTPRGEQGIDYLIDGSYYSVPPAHDASVDAHAPCAEEKDPAGICAQTSSAGTPASHLIACTQGHGPAGIVCVVVDDASADGGAFCCTTGLL
jgi:hypothetical protein